MQGKVIVDEIELGMIEGSPSIVACKGRVISKHRIPELDALCQDEGE